MSAANRRDASLPSLADITKLIGDEHAALHSDLKSRSYIRGDRAGGISPLG